MSGGRKGRRGREGRKKKGVRVRDKGGFRIRVRIRIKC